MGHKVEAFRIAELDGRYRYDEMYCFAIDNCQAWESQRGGEGCTPERCW